MIPVRALALSLCLLLVPAAAAQAAKPKAPKTATFKATLTGSQVTTWSYHVPDNPDDACDAAQDGDGSQMIRYTTKPTRLMVFRGKRLFGGRTTITPILTAKTTVEREGDYKVSYPASSDCDGVAEGDGDGLEPLVRQDCGTRSGTSHLMVSTRARDADEDDFLVPLVPQKDVLFFNGDLDGMTLDYDDCPWWIGGPVDGPSDQQLFGGWERLKESRLFDRRRKAITVSGDETKTYTAEGFTGRTIMTWNLRLRRIG
jgi:hypothetical protein